MRIDARIAKLVFWPSVRSAGRENFDRLLLSKTGALFEEPEFLLQPELKEPRRYASIVAAIARGGTKLGQVVNRVPGIKDTAQITP
jgi:uncharacterized protein